jgi:Family of unknown function (DUF6492)
MKRRYSFATVVFEADLGLMDIQARSMGLYCDPDIVEAIVVIENFVDAVPAAWRERLVAQYGPLAGRVGFAPGAEVTPPAAVSGWMSQQALKLAVSSFIQTDRYVILDAKNHLVHPLHRGFLETETGQPRIEGGCYAEHAMRGHLEQTCRYVGLDPAGPVEHFVSTSTPFTVITAAARALVANMERIEGVRLAEAMERTGVSEFFLYGAALRAAGLLDDLYDWSLPLCQAIWPEEGADDRVVLTRIEAARSNDRAPFLGVHRRAIPHLTEAGRRALADLWAERGLFASAAVAAAFLAAQVGDG